MRRRSITMKLQILLIPLLQVALGESAREVSGYIGDKVTLPSGADPSWDLSEIEWSIFSNNTWIATYRNGRTNTEHVSGYKGRLNLSISTGNLTIHNLSTRDAMTYKIDLYSSTNQERHEKVKLMVMEHLQKPSVQTQTYRGPMKRGCWIEVRCSSSDEGVDFSWQINPPGVTAFNTRLAGGRSALLLAFLNTTQHPAEFSCTISRNMEKTSSVVASKCEDPEPQPKPQQSTPRNRLTFFLVTAAFFGVLLTVCIICCLGGKPVEK